MNAEKAIIFCNTASEACNIFYYFWSQFNENAFLNPLQPSWETLLFHLYTASSGAITKEFLVSEFRQKSFCRLLITTVAFGMGADIPDVRKIVIWGLPPDPITMWQEVGRGGRDSFLSVDTICPFKTQFFRQLKGSNYLLPGTCIRQQILQQFFGCENFTTERKVCEPKCTENCICDGCFCCCVCKSKCICNVSSVMKP